MNDNLSDEVYCLNPVNITSNVRAPGEYKYYYSGENNSSSDKSFLTISTMWFTTKISEDLFLLSSCYTKLYTCNIYYCPKNNIYNIYVYQNKLDYKSENLKLKPIKLIHLEPSYKQKDIISTDPNGKTEVKIEVKIYFGADNYLILNEIDKRLILIDFFIGNFVTIFHKQPNSQDPLYNIIDTYDEEYFFKGETRFRTYVFLSIKYQEKKLSFYKYKYFIIERGNIRNNNFFLHSIDLDLGNGEPLGLKIVKIPKQSSISFQDEEKKQWFYIFCFLSYKRILQLITNYDNLSLYQTLRTLHQYNAIPLPNSENKRSSITYVGFKKDEKSKKNEEEKEIQNNENDNNIIKNNDDNTNDNKNIGSDILNGKKICYWLTSINLWIEKKQIAQTVKIFLNINTKQLCALILFFEIGSVITFPFNYNDSPEEIKKKITIGSFELQIDKLCLPDNKLRAGPEEIEVFCEKIKSEYFGKLAKVFLFKEKYFFKSKTICALTSKNLILAINNKFRILDLETNAQLYDYHFYKENVSSFILFENIGFTFLLTWNKIFKIIFNTRYKIFTEKEIKNNPKIQVNSYKSEYMNFPTFDYKPEDIWNSYCSKLEINSNDSDKNLIKSNINVNNNIKNNGTDNEQNEKKPCVICSKKTDLYCSDCKSKFYCSNEHFKYDYNYTHFYECQFVQFFNRKDIMSIENDEIRYIVLYNELIKLCGRILNFMFTRIFVGKNCHLFLEMLLSLITLLDNFGFYENLSEFCSCNFIPSNDKHKKKPEKILFFEECLYFYVQLQILKCTFTLKSKLYNLTDCYMKIIKNDIIPKLTPKINKRLVSLRCEKLRKDFLFRNELYSNFQSPIFFDLRKIINEAEGFEYINILEIYIIKHLMALSTLIKFKIKLQSSIDVNDTFVDICLMFEEHFREIRSCKNVVPYCYFSISFYLVEIGKVIQSVKLLKKMESSFTETSDTTLKALTYFNLGVLQYALGEFNIGIHNLEIAYKLSINNFLSEKFKYKAMVSLGLAYLNQRNLFKAYVLFQKTIRQLKQIKKQKYELKCIKINAYLNYIIDLYEYAFITKSRLKNNKNKKNNNYNIHQLIDFVQGDYDKQLIVIEQHVYEFLKVVEYIWNLPEEILQQLDKDNQPKQTTNYKEETHQERNLSFTLEQSQMNTFIMRENGVEKEESQKEYDDDIEVNQELFDSLTRQQQNDFKELKNIFLKRDIILRDSLGEIEKFNINYDPEFSIQFKKIIEKLKNNYLLKEIFYCFQNEKWRDELYNFNPNSVLFGLSKYLKLEKIRNVLAIEKSKCLGNIKKEKNIAFKERKSHNEQFYQENDLLKNINQDYNIYPNNDDIYNNNNYTNNQFFFSKNKNDEMSYLEFKERFAKALKENEKTKNYDKLQYFKLKDDYLISLYKNIYLNNPEHDFIFQNPALILNYIFIDISNTNTSKKEENELINKQKNVETENIILNKFNSNLNNSDIIKEEDSENMYINIRSSVNPYENKNQKNNNIFDNKTKIILSPTLKNNKNNKNNINIEDIYSNESSLESSFIKKFYYLKYNIKEDNLKKTKEIELFYIFIRKKFRSSTSSLKGLIFPSFKKKKDNNNPERRSVLPIQFLRYSTKPYTKKMDYLKNNLSEKLKIMNNRKGSAISKTWKKDNNEKNIYRNSNSEKQKKKKKENSCRNLRERLSIDFNKEMGIIIENNIKNESTSEINELSSSKSIDLEKSKNEDIYSNKNENENENLKINENNSDKNINNNSKINDNKSNLNIFNSEKEINKKDIDLNIHNKNNNSNENVIKEEIKKENKGENNQINGKINDKDDINKNSNNQNLENVNIKVDNKKDNMIKNENDNNEEEEKDKIDDNNNDENETDKKLIHIIENIKRNRTKKFNKGIKRKNTNKNIKKKNSINLKNNSKKKENKIIFIKNNNEDIKEIDNNIIKEIKENKECNKDVNFNEYDKEKDEINNKSKLIHKNFDIFKNKENNYKNKIETNFLDDIQMKNELIKNNNKNIYGINNNTKNDKEINNFNNINKYNKNKVMDKNNNNIQDFNAEKKLFDISEISNSVVKNSRKKSINKKNNIIKNNSVKYFNKSIFSLISTNKRNNSIKKKLLTISTRKLLSKPKTCDYFSREYLNQEKEKNYNNNKKIENYPKTQRKNYGFKNKKEQESELISGTIMYLQNGYYISNKNKKNIKENHIFNSSGITMRELQHNFNIIENNNHINKNKYKVPYDYKKKGKAFGENSTISLNSTSSGIFLLNNNNSFYGDETLSIDNNSNLFQKEMNRIINFNKKMKSIEKDNNNNIYNNILKNIKDKEINKLNNNMKKSNSQPNFFEKKKIKMNRNENKTFTKKNKSIYTSNKKFDSITYKDKIGKNDLSRNNNNLEYNLKSHRIKKSNISDLNYKINKENNIKSFVDYYQDEQNLFQKRHKKKINQNENNNNQNNDSKFRFVLDKYIKKQKKRNINNKSDNKNNKNKEAEKSNTKKSKTEKNSGIYYSTIKKNKNNSNNDINNDSFFDEGINLENLYDIKGLDNKILDKNKEINNKGNYSSGNKINFGELEKLNLSNIKVKEDSNCNSKNLCKIDYENINDNDKNIQLKENNNISTIKKDLNNDICDNNIVKNSFSNSSYNRLDEENNLKEKINIPCNISPIIKNCPQNNLKKLNDSLSKSDFLYSLNIKNSNDINNINIISSSKDIKADYSNKNNNNSKEFLNSLNIENKSSSAQNKIFRKIDEIMSQTHEKPNNFIKIKNKNY